MSAACRIVSEVGEAVALLAAGGVVAFPTETVYGLGADATNPEAVGRIFRIKDRPTDHPLIVHLADISQMNDWAMEIPDEAYLLAERFWPGPLTLILRRDGRVPDAVTGGLDTVGLRVPGHPVALNLLRLFGGGIAAPSANRFGRISPTTARHVLEELGDRLELIVDSGPCRVGLESTIVSLVGARPQPSDRRTAHGGRWAVGDNRARTSSGDLIAQLLRHTRPRRRLRPRLGRVVARKRLRRHPARPEGRRRARAAGPRSPAAATTTRTATRGRPRRSRAPAASPPGRDARRS